MKIKHITDYLETIAPLPYQENYDNAGLIVGDKQATLTNVLLCLDSTEAVIDEAITNNCNLVVAHHPIVFSGLKKITGRNYVERTLIKAIKNDIAIYAAHTNLDNIATGVNRKICETIGLINTRILVPKKNTLKKLSIVTPIAEADGLRKQLSEVLDKKNTFGEVFIQSSFNTLGASTYQHHNPQQAELKIELIFQQHLAQKVVKTIHKLLPNSFYHISSIDNTFTDIGSGMIGQLSTAMPLLDFLQQLKDKMQTSCIRYTQSNKEKVKTIAVCGGAGSSLLPMAKAQKADVFITADYKYHQFFDAENQLVIADIGHYESEQFTIDLFYEILTKKFSNFTPIISKTNTNPINYI